MKQLEEGVFVAGQIAVDDVPALAAVGIRTIVNNRPDGEAHGQPEGGEIGTAAGEAGIDYLELPVTQLTGEGIEAMRRVLDQAERPVLAFCASGTRSTYMWALARSGSLDGDEIEAAAARAGYDLTPIRRFL